MTGEFRFNLTVNAQRASVIHHRSVKQSFTIGHRSSVTHCCVQFIKKKQKYHFLLNTFAELPPQHCQALQTIHSIRR